VLKFRFRRTNRELDLSVEVQRASVALVIAMIIYLFSPSGLAPLTQQAGRAVAACVLPVLTRAGGGLCLRWYAQAASARASVETSPRR
jgi:O-antigen/teichoic acid export membrane protein